MEAVDTLASATVTGCTRMATMCIEWGWGMLHPYCLGHASTPGWGSFNAGGNGVVCVQNLWHESGDR